MNRALAVNHVLIAIVSGIALTACNASSSREVEWRPVICFRSQKPIERVRCGRPDSEDPRLQAVSVDQAGDVALMHFDDRGEPRSEVLYRNGGELTGLAIGDVDPAIPGVELYVGGSAFGDTGEVSAGAVFQIVVASDPSARARVREIYSGPAFVHSIEVVEPQESGGSAQLLVSTYLGEVHLLKPATGTWVDRTLYREPSTDAEAIKVKDACFLADAHQRPRHEALVAFKGGRLLHLDISHPESARTIHEEPGGLSRVTPDPNGGAYVTGYAGRLMHFVRTSDGFRFDVLDQEGADSGLRGAVLGKFPVEATTAHLAIFGFHKRCRALVAHEGALDPITLYVDIDRGHTIDAADLVPGNDADEILIGGYSNQVTMLVAH